MGKLGAVLGAVRARARNHGADLGRRKEPARNLGALAETAGGPALDPAPGAPSIVAEELLGLRVDQHDVAIPVHDDDGVRGGLEQPRELVLRALSLGDVRIAVETSVPPRSPGGLRLISTELGAVLRRP